MGNRIVIATWGSYGDLFPYVGLGIGLRERGHQVALAAPALYQELIQGEGLGFHPTGPPLDPTQTALAQRVMEPKRGTEVILRELLMPHIRESYRELNHAAEGADLLVSHPVTFAMPLVAEMRSLPWAATVLAPISFFSPHDLPVFPNAPRAVHLRRLGTGVTGVMVRAAKSIARRWSRPVDQLRRELGLPPRRNPVFEGQFSPLLNLALFSRVLAEPQPDWPPSTRVTGFIPYNGPAEMPSELRRFLDQGPAPVVFTLGSSAVMAAGDFYRESAEAARRLGRRAVLLVGRDPRNLPPGQLPEGVIAVEFAPHAELFPRAAAVVHQAGIGTTGQALRSGRPQLIVPHAHDQPDNAFRVTNLGAARTLFPRSYSAPRVARELAALLDDPAYARRAEEVSARVRSENGVAAACDALEQLISG